MRDSLFRLAGCLAALVLLAAACGGESAADECSPASCGDPGLECGVHDNLCGGEIDCGGCEGDYRCEEGTCVLPPCTPDTCESLGARCGTYEDGCGETLDCGPCGSCPDEPLCFVPEPGSPDALVEVASGPAPTLVGGSIEEGWYELVRLLFFTDDFLSSMIEEVSITSNGNTYGSLELWDDQWGLGSLLDLHVVIAPPFVDPVEQSFTAPVDLGGCYEVSGNRITGDLLQCGGSWLEGSEPPDGLDFEAFDEEVHLLIIIDRQVFIDAMPPDSQSIAEMAITGDLPVLMQLERGEG